MPERGYREEEAREPSVYEVLGVSPNASQEEIGQAFRELGKRYHPSAEGGGGGGDEKRFKKISAAYHHSNCAYLYFSI